MKKKILSLLLAIILVAGLFPVVSSSAETTATTTAPTTATSAPASETTTPTTPENNGAASVSVKLCETNIAQNYLAVLTATKGGKPVYAVIKGAGAPSLVTNGSTPSNNYVKLEYPKDGVPTITLMNAKLRSTGNVLDLSDFDAPVKIVVAGDSSIESTGKCGIFRTSFGDITIVGPKKLTISAHSSAISFGTDAHISSLTLKNLKLKASTTSDSAGRTLNIPAGNLTVDGSNVDLTHRTGIGVYLGKSNVSGLGNATIAHSVFSSTSKDTALQLDGNLAISDSNVQFSSDTQAVYCNGNLTVNTSTAVMTGHSTTKETIDIRGDFILHSSTAEILGTNFVIFSNTTIPITLGDYNAVAGIAKGSTVPYNKDLISAYQYYYAESIDQSPDPTAPTGTAPTGTETDPTGTETNPTGTGPTETEPTDFTDPTLSIEEPTEPTETTAATPPTPPINPQPKGNSTLFWILAIVMALGACGAATAAIFMFRKTNQEDLEEPDEVSVEDLEEDIEEVPAEISKKLAFKNFLRKILSHFFKEEAEDEESIESEEVSEEVENAVDSETTEDSEIVEDTDI